jgi:rubredoxin
MSALLWTCRDCGFVYEGGQPKYTCPICEAYKTSFIDLPQHIEAQVREEFEERHFNHIECRERRLELMKEEDAIEEARVAGRILPANSGNHMDPSLND